MRAFSDFDILLAPATPCSAPSLGQQTMTLNGEQVSVRPNIGVMTQPLSAIGLPIITVPVVTEHALPLGVQIIAPPWREDFAFPGRGTCSGLGSSGRKGGHAVHINDPEILAEVEKAFLLYEHALMANDLDIFGQSLLAKRADIALRSRPEFIRY